MNDIVFVGLGKMGAPMARHLHAAGYAVRGVEPSAERRRALSGLNGAGPVPYATLSEALAPGRPELVISSLPDDAALEAVAIALAEAGPPTPWVDTSTVSLAASHAAAAMCAANGRPHLRAPVSGNAVMAESARLSVLASGDHATYLLCEPLFACWGPQRLYLGAADEARAAKLALNLMVAGTSALLAEALVLGQLAGCDRDSLWRVIEASAVASPLLLAKAPALRNHDYAPTFTVAQMRKDLGLMSDVARTAGVALPIATHTDATLAEAEHAGAGGLDYAVIVREAERRAGLAPTSNTNLPPQAHP